MYLTPESIAAALAANPTSLYDLLAALECTHSLRTDAIGRNVYTSDATLAFTGTLDEITAWLRNSDPACDFAELSPMRRDRLVAAFVSPGRDLLGGIRKFASKQGAGIRCDVQLVADIWDCFTRYGGWSYLECLESPAAVASEALGLWQSQVPGDDRDDPGAYED